jgi:hypothetical protein
LLFILFLFLFIQFLSFFHSGVKMGPVWRPHNCISSPESWVQAVRSCYISRRSVGRQI